MTALDRLVGQLRAAYPGLKFVAGDSFYWCPESRQIVYSRQAASRARSAWSLLHETSHALLGHSNYQADLELLQLEVAAWQHAVLLAGQYNSAIDNDYVQDCLDTYRDWLYRRSLCPACGTQSLQNDLTSHYQCFNCHERWHVSRERFCRPYRRSQKPYHAPAATVFALQTPPK